MLTTENIRDDVLEYLANNDNVTRDDFAKMAKISPRTLNEILSYSKEKGDEPNWTRATALGIMKVLRCEVFYTPEHKIR